MTIDELNAMPADECAAALRACLADAEATVLAQLSGLPGEGARA
jgi:hypothetical protein